MKFTVVKDDFISDLSIVNSNIDTNSAMAILLNVYLEAQADGSIMMMSYNGKNGVKSETTGVVEVPGRVSLMSRKLLDIVKQLPGDRIVLESKEENVNEIMIHPEGLDNPMFDIIGVPAEGYPVFKEYNWENYILIAQEILLEQIDSTEFAAASDKTKAAFMGVYIEEAVEGFLTFVTTDGKRLSVITREYEDKVGEVETGVIVSMRAFRTIHAALSSGDVQFAVDDRQAFFKIGSTYIFTNRVDGKFPNYKDVIPSEEVNTATVAADELARAISSVSVMSDPDSGKIKMEFSSNSILVTTSHPVYGVARYEMECDYSGTEIAIALNYRSLSEYTKVVSGKTIKIVINSQSSPLLLRPENDDNYLYVTMPMKLVD